MASFSYKKISIFRSIASLFLRHFSSDNKLYYAVSKLEKRTQNIQENYVDKQADIRRDHAMIDPKDKRLLMDGGNYVYTKEAEKRVQEELRKLMYEEVDLEPHIVPEHDLPVLSFEYTGNDGKLYSVSEFEVRDAFEGFVIEQKSE